MSVRQAKTDPFGRRRLRIVRMEVHLVRLRIRWNTRHEEEKDKMWHYSNISTENTFQIITVDCCRSGGTGDGAERLSAQLGDAAENDGRGAVRCGRQVRAVDLVGSAGDDEPIGGARIDRRGRWSRNGEPGRRSARAHCIRDTAKTLLNWVHYLTFNENQNWRRVLTDE